ncbi:MAG: HYR domain-containing protein [Saprospiraceae bacterium]|nr:HYR domain-containing protein [Saprospiraceae bacterium]
MNFTVPTIGSKLVLIKPNISNWIFMMICMLFTNSLSAQLSCVMACHDTVNVSLNQWCYAKIKPDMVMTSYLTSCPGTKIIQVFNNQGISIGDTVTGAYIGQSLMVKVKDPYSGNSCWSAVKIFDKLGPNLTCKDITVNCTEDTSPNSVGTIEAIDACSPMVDKIYTDVVSNLGCSQFGFSGICDHKNWGFINSYNSNGTIVKYGIDSITIDGANNKPISVTPKYVSSYQIIIPSDGQISFDWRLFGGTDPNIDCFILTINDSCIQLSNYFTKSGTIIKNLKAGDRFVFELLSDGSADRNKLTIKNFRFGTSFIKVVNRNWTATDAYGNSKTCLQRVSVKKNFINEIILPKNKDNIQSPALSCGQDTAANNTGWPYLDKDGNLATFDPIYLYQGGNACFGITYSDQSIKSCGNSLTIIRKWVLVDWCTSEIKYHDQLIKVMDNKPPTITCPPALTFNTNANSCNANIQLPLPIVDDECSNPVNSTVNWIFGPGLIHNNIPLGTYPVIYTATDACGNSATCSSTIIVKDEIVPTAICITQTTIALPTNGEAWVPAQSFDAGSFDNCCLQKYEVKRNDDPASIFGPSVKFICLDSGKDFIPISLKLTDCHGLYNTCDVLVKIQDKYKPTITCPSAVVIDCQTNRSDLNVFGKPVASDNCGYTIAYNLKENISNCGVGNITRTWTVSDLSGQAISCSQVITVANSLPWNKNNTEITWPQDFSTANCGGDLSPNALKAPYNKPVLQSSGNCSQVAMTYSDEVFSVAPPSCLQILRKWVVIDWCQFQVGSQIGKWEHTQVLKIEDTEYPELFIPNDTLVKSQDATCGTGYVKLNLATAKDCDPNVKITNSKTNGGADASGAYPFGTTIVIFTATDGCGNSTQMEMKVIVVDGKKPVVICKSGLTVTLNPMPQGGMVSLSPRYFDNFSSDNCTPTSQLKYSFSSDLKDTLKWFTCDSLGAKLTQMWVTDAAGNQDFCNVYVLVEDNMNACGSGSGIVTGTIATENGNKVADVETYLMNTNNKFMTGSNGLYQFQNLLFGQNYAIKPKKENDIRNGLSTIDLIMINKFVLGLETLSPYQMIAADVNNSGTVSTADLVELRKVILGITDTFPNNKSWRFVPKTYNFPNPLNPFQNSIPDQYLINPLFSNMNNADFVGVKVGDINGSVKSSFTSATERENLEIEMEYQIIQKNGRTEIEFYLPKGIKGWGGQLAILGVGNEGFDIENLNESSILNSFLRNNQLNINWISNNLVETTNQPIFKIVFSNRLENIHLNFENEFLAPLFFGEQKEYRINLKERKTNNDQFLVEQNYPNPFSENTKIPFFIPSNGDITLIIKDINGKMIYTQNANFEKGNQSWAIDKSIVHKSGIYFYEIIFKGKSITHKMIAMD